MEFFIKVSFWLSFAGLIMRSIAMCGASYPRKSEYSLGADTVLLIIGIAWCIWAYSLVWS